MCRSKKADGRRQHQKLWKQPKGKDRTEMKKRNKKIDVHLASWISMEYREKMRRCKGKCDIFCRKEEMEEQFNKEAKEGWRYAADAARITDEKAGDEDRKHTSGVVFGGGSQQLCEQSWEQKRERLNRSQATKEESPNHGYMFEDVCVSSRCSLWHSEGWTPRNEALLEAVLKQARTTRHPRLIACDAKMCPEDFGRSLWLQRELMHVVVPKEASACRSKGPKGEWIERTYDYVVASGSLYGKISQMEVVEEFESRLHKAVSFCC